MGLFSKFKNISKKENSKSSENKNIEKVNLESTIKIQIETQKNKSQYNQNYIDTVFLDRVHNKPLGTSKKDYPRYFETDFFIDDPVSKHKKMIEDGYLEVASLEYLLDSFKVADLKNILSGYNLETSGKKAILINRIIDNIDNSVLYEKYKSNLTYVLTTKAIHFIAENHMYLELFNHKNYNIEPKEYEETLSTFDFEPSFNDVVWRILNERVLKYASKGDYGLVRNTYFNMYELRYEEKNYTDALQFLIFTLNYDLSGCGNNYIIDPYDLLLIPPFIAKQINKLSKYYDKRILDKALLINLPFKYFSPDIFEEILNKLLAGDEVNLEDYKKYANKK